MGLQKDVWYHVVSHAGGGRCLNVHGNETIANNRNVTLYSWQDVGAQRWQLRPHAGHALLCSALGQGFALDYYRGSRDAGNCDVYRAEGNDSDALLEAYTVDAAAGLYRLGLACHPGLYLTAAGRQDGSDVRWQPYTGAETQLWRFVAEAQPPQDDCATYPCRTMRITQRHDGGRLGDGCSHINNSALGAPADYPVDEACADGGRSPLYCPCAEMEVRRVYGVGNGGTNTVWLRSTAPVRMPGLAEKQHLVLMAVHPNDDTLAGLTVGRRFVRGEAMFLEGDDGLATGNHFHLSCGTGDLAARPGCTAGWAKNAGGVWVLTVTGRTLKIDEAFYLDPAFTTVKDAAGYRFTTL